jgi:protein Tex
LTYVSGVGPQIAGNIVNYRNENGAFKSRADLKKVPRLGAKAFEQAAGFLRISDSKNPLDNSAVHPESYSIVKNIAKDRNCKIEDIMSNSSLKEQIDLNNYVSDTVGLPTLVDIIEELEKPGRDPRPAFEHFSFSDEVHSVSDLKKGMKLPGIVTNVTKFGAFVDVGAHQDGLVHISQLADRFVKDPNDIVKVNQKVEVTVLEIDTKRKRIALSMKAQSKPQKTQKHKQAPKKNQNPPKKKSGFDSPLGSLFDL